MYKCPFCHVTSNSKATMINHMKVKHSKEVLKASRSNSQDSTMPISDILLATVLVSSDSSSFSDSRSSSDSSFSGGGGDFGGGGSSGEF